MCDGRDALLPVYVRSLATMSVRMQANDAAEMVQPLVAEFARGCAAIARLSASIAPFRPPRARQIVAAAADAGVVFPADFRRPTSAECSAVKPPAASPTPR
jgi:hypothetical protein